VVDANMYALNLQISTNLRWNQRTKVR